jgi:hypothetical protein
MKRRLISAVSALALGLALSFGVWTELPQAFADKIRSGASSREVAFEDQTSDIVGHAERLIEKNRREGAVFDLRWYSFKRFGEFYKLFLKAERVLFSQDSSPAASGIVSSLGRTEEKLL